MSVTDLLAVWVALVTGLTASQPAQRTTAPPVAILAPAASDCPQWYGLALEVGWPADDWQTLDEIMYCESRCNPNAHNPSGATGLLQIMPFHAPDADLYDPATNLRIGLEVKARQGWRAWSCY